MKVCMFTDIHWGAKNNSQQHNSDCDAYIDWFISQCKKECCDMIVFMGDWFENRNAINVATLNASFNGLKKLNALGIPIHFCIGNHDLYHRESRKEFSTLHFQKFENVNLINETQLIDNMAFIPYLFKDEYPSAAAFLQNKKIKYAFGHLEFKNFVITGTDRVMDHGPDHKLFSTQKYIFSGHFHKRQIQDNVIYIGNTFPTNFGDVWDDARGMCVLNTQTDSVNFYDWHDCPKYRRIKLSDLLSDKIESLPTNSRVKCMVDVEISYSEAQQVKEELTQQLNLREFSFEESVVERSPEDLSEEVIEEFEMASLNDAVVKMIESGITASANIDPKLLIEIYSKL